MSVFLYIAGLLIGLSLFLYILSGIQKGREKILPAAVQAVPKRNGTVTAGDVTYRGLPPRAPGERLCPLCASKLTKYEALYASRIDTDSGARILIHGCRYCYKPEDKADIRRKSDY